ncbi:MULTISPECIES: nuclear transport factor 2 family protein [unclassified Frankia]|uniref:nuclear transport factor 2 family protein n=1 Tax=unclassified Frankia TaxID=2632575 RepID=UPI002AD22EE6|nr:MULTISPECIES: nuclear transport factor 2 family protein [unclassified Frankia]
MRTAAEIEAGLDRADVTEVLYRYASCIDKRDVDGIRVTLADDLWAQYGNADPIVGGDAVANWIDEGTRECVWQHHLLSVYHVDLVADHATALIYHTSHQVFRASPETVHVLVGRYHNQLRRTADGWKISRLLFEILWGERRVDSTGYLAAVGGSGPQVYPR